MFKLSIETRNSAFEDTALEVTRILEELVADLKAGKEEGNLHDINGNNVGEYKLTNR